MTSEHPVWVSNEDVHSRVSMELATRAVRRSLQNGLDPAHDFSRSISRTDHGQLMIMP